MLPRHSLQVLLEEEMALIKAAIDEDDENDDDDEFRHELMAQVSPRERPMIAAW